MMMKKIDVHAHILPEKWPDWCQKFGYSGWINIRHLDECNADGSPKAVMIDDDGRPFRNVDAKLFNVQRRLQMMEQQGVDKQILSVVPVMFSYWAKPGDTSVVARYMNDYISGVVRSNPEHFIGLGQIPLNDIELAVKELIRCKTELGMNGLIIQTHVNGIAFHDEKFEPFWKAAADHDMPLFIHPWDVTDAGGRWSQYMMPYIAGMTVETTAAALSLCYGGVLHRYPSLKILLSHGGGSLPYLGGRAHRAYETYPEITRKTTPNCDPDKYLRQNPNVCADSIVYRPEALDLELNYFGPDSIMLGSDYPFLLGETGEWIENQWKRSNDLKEKILWKNSLRFFNIDYS